MPLEIKVQSAVLAALKDGHIDRSEAQGIVDLVKNAPPSEEPAAPARIMPALSGLADAYADRFDPGAREVITQFVATPTWSQPQGHFAAEDIYDTYDAVTANGPIDEGGVDKLLTAVANVRRNSRDPKSAAPNVANGLLLSLVGAAPEAFTPSALDKIETALQIPKAPRPYEAALAVTSDGTVTGDEANQLISNVEKYAQQFPSTNVEDFLRNFRVETNDQLTPEARAALDQRLGVTADKIDYQPGDRTVAAVLPKVVKDNKISRREAQELIAMATVNNGTSVEGARDLKTLVTMYGDRMTPDAKQLLQTFVSEKPQMGTSSKYWGQVGVGGFETDPDGTQHAKVALPTDASLAMRQALARMTVTGGETISTQAAPFGIIVKSRPVSTFDIVLNQVRTPAGSPKKYEVKLVATSLPGPSSDGGKMVLTSTRQYTAHELQKGGVIDLSGPSNP